jgi:hypothetical protein
MQRNGVLVPTGGRFAHLLQVPVAAVNYEKFDLCTTGLDRDTCLLLVGLTLSHALGLCRLVASPQMYKFDARVKHCCARLRFLKFSPPFWCN